MQISEAQKKYLRAIGHNLKPVVTVANAGVSESVLKEFDTTIGHHELIKVKIRGMDRESRNAAIEKLCAEGAAMLVTRIGNVALLYRRNDENPKIALPRR